MPDMFWQKSWISAACVPTLAVLWMVEENFSGSVAGGRVAPGQAGWRCSHAASRHEAAKRDPDTPHVSYGCVVHDRLHPHVPRLQTVPAGEVEAFQPQRRQAVQSCMDID